MVRDFGGWGGKDAIQCFKIEQFSGQTSFELNVVMALLVGLHYTGHINVHQQ